jgi:hypothetical protein
MHLEEETSLGRPTISDAVSRAIKKVLRRANIAFSYQRYVAAYPAGRVHRAVPPK